MLRRDWPRSLSLTGGARAGTMPPAARPCRPAGWAVRRSTRAIVALACIAVVVLGMRRPGAASAQPQESFALTDFIVAVRGNDVTTIRRSFPEYNQGVFETVFGAGPGIALANVDQALMFITRLARTPAGVNLDVGHVITGLEAATAPTPASRAVEQATGCAMTAAVTWSGDVGTALYDYLVESGAGDPTPVYDREAPPEDLIGDVDGWVLGTESGGVPVDVAALLEGAYLTGDLEATRFRRFAATLGGTDGPRLSDAARTRAADEIRCFARALAALGGTDVSAGAIADASPYFVDRFIQFIEDGLAAEGGA